MNITRITAIPLSYRLPEGKTVTMGVGSTLKRDAIIVRVDTSEGLVGYGESHPGRSPGAIVSHIHNTLAPMLVGMSATDVVGTWQRVHRMQFSSHGLGAGAAMALSGIDMALWDIRGKAANMPLYELLGGSHKRLPAYAGGIALGYQPEQSLAEEAQSYIEQGYRAIKLRLGDNVKDDIKRSLHVRKAIGDDIDILTDANTAYTIAQARRVLPVLADIHAGWLEEPFACNDFASYREAAKITPLVPLAAGENHFMRFEFAQMLEAGAVQVWQPDLSKTGGITEAIRIAALASAFRIPINPHSSATGLNHAASLHFLAATENSGYFEACVSQFNPFRDMFGPTFSIGKDGCVEPPSGPGLGVEVDESIFKDFPVIDGPGYVVKF
ncbi:mandelate racemase/muconate lactonizing enzyme family protein [Pollutimonas harenae]|uniref:Mandelate racemase/muconate lactonizing enzyme family protein n=1 Tax=Pollutimonas harenae TaxID=657015 RepID=A0A853GTN0_9BURK|nr:mandelate racemase/muconate lactonizing enzyme family protein [Pollutimonas harenae]NYT84136.1 mandelate racemase/muconate lactonizing enzyme family protein [Pollutimonas harenae]TEA73447.1 mandelate racemase/muconate lactonizing enzyme family protein [Pollutimonas harenae]